MAIRQVSFASPQQQQSPLVQALAPRDPRTMLAIQALQEGSSTAPVLSVGEGLARVAQGALGGFMMGQERRRGEEASGRLADAILSSLPEDQRAGPLAMALRDPNVAPGLIPGMLQQMATRREQWTPDPTGMFQVNSVTGERRPLESPERARAMAEAGRDPNSRFQIVPGTDGQPPLVVDRSQLGGVAPGQVAQAIIGRESGGNPTAQNPMSSATGAGQFLDQTWLDMAPRLGVDPQLLARAQQGDPQARQQILALRNDPQLSARATELYVQQNGQRLQAAGIPTTPENLYLAHFLGPEGALRFLSTQPNAPVSQAVGPQAFAANRQVFTRDGREMTVGEVYGAIRQDIQRRMGGTQTAQAPAQTATDAGPQYPPGVRPLIGGGQAALPRRDAFRMESDLHERLLGNPTVRAARDVVPIFSSMVNSAGRDDIVSDIDLVYGLAKIMDPNSVVRESEQRIVVTSAQGLTDQMIGWINGLNGGRRLQPEARQNILATAQQRVTGVVEAANNLRNEVGEFATGYGLNRDRVMGRAFALPEWSRPAPAAAEPPPPPRPPPLPPQTPILQPGIGRGVQVPIPQQPAIVPETQPAQPAVPPRGAIPRDQILRELRNRGIQVQ